MSGWGEILVITLSLWMGIVYAEPTISLHGALKERGTRAPLAEVSVFILPHKLKTTTDREGRFSFEGVPVGPFTWVVNFPGYLKLERPDVQNEEGENRDRVLYLER